MTFTPTDTVDYTNATATVYINVVNSNTLTWTGGVSNNWGDAGNWVGASVPSNGNSLVFPTTSYTSPTDNMPGLTINSITISGTGYQSAGRRLLT